MPEIQIRPTVAADLSRLTTLDHSVTSESVWQLELRRENGQASAIFREVRLPRSITVLYPRNPFSLAEEWTTRSMIFTALMEQNIVGYVSLVERRMDAAAYVTDLVVNAAHRRQGVATALLSAAQHWSTENSCRRIMLELQSKNLPAIRLAQKLGYEFCGYNDQCYLTGDLALFFGRLLR